MKPPHWWVVAWHNLTLPFTEASTRGRKQARGGTEPHAHPAPGSAVGGWGPGPRTASSMKPQRRADPRTLSIRNRESRWLLCFIGVL